MQTVVETLGYLKTAEAIFSQAERDQIVTMVAANPECGEVMQGTGGFRKVPVDQQDARHSYTPPRTTPLAALAFPELALGDLERSLEENARAEAEAFTAALSSIRATVRERPLSTSSVSLGR